MRFWISCLLAISSGILASFSFPPLNAHWLCWVAWAPLIASIWWGHSKRIPHTLRITLLGYLAGVAFFCSSLLWLCEVTVVGWFALALYLGIYPALWALFIGTVGDPKKEKDDIIWLNSWNNLWVAILGAATWVALEWIRGFLFTGFGWNAQGVALHSIIPLIQISDITGVYGLSFLVIMVNLIIVIMGKRFALEFQKYGFHPHFDFILTLTLVTGIFVYGARQLSAPAQNLSTIRIGCIQASIPQHLKWDPGFDKQILETYQKQSEAAIQLQPHLLIWPEAATPRPALLDSIDRAVVEGVAKSFSGDFLMGTIHFNETQSFNSAVLFTRYGTETQVYSKMHLVPFGEYIPLRHTFPLFAWIVGPLIPYDFTSGTQPVIFSMRSLPLRIAPLICFEDTLGSLARRFVQAKANFFTVITNDGWFQRSAGSEQHLANAIFRSAEFKLPMVRCANTGVTCFINRFGAVTQKLRDPKEGTFGAGILIDELHVPSQPIPTLYAQWGDIFSISALALSFLAIVSYLLYNNKIPRLKFFPTLNRSP